MSQRDPTHLLDWRRCGHGLEAHEEVLARLDLLVVEARHLLQLLERLAEARGLPPLQQRRRFRPRQAGHALELDVVRPVDVQRPRRIAEEVLRQVVQDGRELLVRSRARRARSCRRSPLPILHASAAPPPTARPDDTGRTPSGAPLFQDPRAAPGRRPAMPSGEKDGEVIRLIVMVFIATRARWELKPRAASDNVARSLNPRTLVAPDS